MIENYEIKKAYLYKKYSGHCIGCNNVLQYRYVQLQHRCANHKWRREAYPLFLNSLLNLAPICSHCNCYAHRSAGLISEYRANKYEAFLSQERHKKCKNFVNNLVWS
jgi:hypothetical protein